MNILFIAIITAIGYYVILRKAIGNKYLKKTSVFWDIIFTLGLPILFIGTFSGMATAVLAGLIFSLITGVTKKYEL